MMFWEWYKKREKYLSIGAFALGFTIDNITLTRIDLWIDNLILASYLFLAGAGIFSFHVLRQKFSRWNISERGIFLLPLLIQFAFGGLFSGYFVFYSRSASFATSWLFVVLIILLLVGNEFFKRKYARIDFQVSIFFITLFSFAIFYLPVLFGEFGAHIFLLSGVVSLAFIWLFIKLLALIVPRKIKRTKHTLGASILSIYLVFNVLYFTNIIPPIPLSLKEGNAYYFTERVRNEYRAETDVIEWYGIHKKLASTLHVRKDAPVYVFSSVFAPTNIRTEIFYLWQYFDEEEDEWVETDRFSYQIIGGRDGGYRGYTQKRNVFSGKWRVDIVTQRGQIIGRISFRVVESDSAPERVMLVL